MMKYTINIMRVVLFILLVGVMGACKSSLTPRVTSQTNDTIVKTQTLRDTIIQTKADSSYYKALLDCQNGKVVLKQTLQVKAGKIANLPNIKLTDNVLVVDNVVEAQKIPIQLKENHIQRIKTVLKVKTEFVARELTWWQSTQIYFGRFFIGLLILILLTAILRLLKII